MVDIEDVKHVADLSRLEFLDSELLKIQEDLSSIVNYCSQLSMVDTSSTETIGEEQGELRADIVCPSIDKADVVRNAPFHNDSAFIVPRVVE